MKDRDEPAHAERASMEIKQARSSFPKIMVSDSSGTQTMRAVEKNGTKEDMGDHATAPFRKILSEEALNLYN